MLSRDEQTNGMIFILKLWNAADVPTQWVETLRGAVALRWYDIYRDSDWAALRAEALGVFHNSVTEEQAERVRTSRHRCIYIHTQSVRTSELEQRGIVVAM